MGEEVTLGDLITDEALAEVAEECDKCPQLKGRSTNHEGHDDDQSRHYRICGSAMCGSYVCTRSRDHSGQHVAHNYGGVCADEASCDLHTEHHADGEDNDDDEEPTCNCGQECDNTVEYEGDWCDDCSQCTCCDECRDCNDGCDCRFECCKHDDHCHEHNGSC